MLRSIAGLIIISFFLVVPLSAGDVPVPDKQEGAERFSMILYYYGRILDGLPGSRGFHCYEMTGYLNKQTGKIITTDHDFRLVCDGPSLRIVSAFPERNWLVLHVKNLPEALEGLRKNGTMPPFQEWWRRGVLLSITGKLTHFRLDRGERVSVHLFLSDITIESLPPVTK